MKQINDLGIKLISCLFSVPPSFRQKREHKKIDRQADWAMLQIKEERLIMALFFKKFIEFIS